MSDFLASTAEVIENIEEIDCTLRKGVMGAWEWSVCIRARGVIQHSANSYSGKSWLMANAGVIGDAIDSCFAQANLWIRKGEELKVQNKQGWVEKEDIIAVKALKF